MTPQDIGQWPKNKCRVSSVEGRERHGEGGHGDAESRSEEQGKNEVSSDQTDDRLKDQTNQRNQKE
jgi:hypothetical protein